MAFCVRLIVVLLLGALLGLVATSPVRTTRITYTPADLEEPIKPTTMYAEPPDDTNDLYQVDPKTETPASLLETFLARFRRSPSYPCGWGKPLPIPPPCIMERRTMIPE